MIARRPNIVRQANNSKLFHRTSFPQDTGCQVHNYVQHVKSSKSCKTHCSLINEVQIGWMTKNISVIL